MVIELHDSRRNMKVREQEGKKNGSRRIEVEVYDCRREIKVAK